MKQTTNVMAASLFMFWCCAALHCSNAAAAESNGDRVQAYMDEFRAAVIGELSTDVPDRFPFDRFREPVEVAVPALERLIDEGLRSQCGSWNDFVGSSALRFLTKLSGKGVERATSALKNAGSVCNMQSQAANSIYDSNPATAFDILFPQVLRKPKKWTRLLAPLVLSANTLERIDKTARFIKKSVKTAPHAELRELRGALGALERKKSDLSRALSK